MIDRPKLTRPSEVKAWIASHEFLPSKVLGQNFLIDENILRIMVDSAAVHATDRVLEIGPGLGILTEPLMEKAEHVVAIEKDKRLAAYLKEAFSPNPRFTLISSDALDLDLDEVATTHRLNKMVANLPYSVGSRILVECFQRMKGFDRLVVTVQLEVGERLAAKTDTSDYGLLSIWAQLDYDVTLTKRIAPSCFHPRPQVTSAIVTMNKTFSRRANLNNAAKFDALIKRAFSQRRKQIGTILNGFAVSSTTPSALDALGMCGIEPKRRPETLTVDDWVRLSDALSGS